MEILNQIEYWISAYPEYSISLGVVFGLVIILLSIAKLSNSAHEKGETNKAEELDVDLPNYDFGRANHKWTRDDLLFLDEHWDWTNKALSKVLDRTPKAIEDKRNVIKSGEKSESDISDGGGRNPLHNTPEYSEARKIATALSTHDHKGSIGRAELTIPEVVAIYISRKSNRELAKLAPVASSTIKDIKNKENWQWLTNQVDKLLRKEKENGTMGLGFTSNKSSINGAGNIEIDIDAFLDQANLSKAQVTKQSRKLSPEDVTRIYISSEEPELLSKIFGVTETHIKGIKYKNVWKWLTNQIDKYIAKESNSWKSFLR